mmetsp:Transcript_13264/g.37225  ORF Transcript_13264/g.37225 Transcript_13264/m.37225 type:complete len:235 (-) Transcript_13264:108-812(-)
MMSWQLVLKMAILECLATPRENMKPAASLARWYISWYVNSLAVCSPDSETLTSTLPIFPPRTLAASDSQCQTPQSSSTSATPPSGTARSVVDSSPSPCSSLLLSTPPAKSSASSSGATFPVHFLIEAIVVGVSGLPHSLPHDQRSLWRASIQRRTGSRAAPRSPGRRQPINLPTDSDASAGTSTPSGRLTQPLCTRHSTLRGSSSPPSHSHNNNDDALTATHTQRNTRTHAPNE